VEALVEAVGEGAAAFAVERAALDARVGVLEALEAEAEAAGAGAATAPAPDPADAHLSAEEARAALAAQDEEARALTAQLKVRVAGGHGV
jgi:hypothetical protein